MKYAIAKKVIQNGDVLLFGGKAVYSHIIKWWTKSDYSHAAMAVWVDLPTVGRTLCVIEAHVFKGVRLIPLDTAIKVDYWDYGGTAHWLPLKGTSNRCRANLVNFCLDQWGNGYASPYQFMLIGSHVGRWIRAKRGESFDTDIKKTHCSELVSRAFCNDGYDCPKEPALIYPNDLIQFSDLSPPVLLEQS